MKPGEHNGKFLGHIANGESIEQLRQRVKELRELNLEYAKMWIEFRGK